MANHIWHTYGSVMGDKPKFDHHFTDRYRHHGDASAVRLAAELCPDLEAMGTGDGNVRWENGRKSGKMGKNTGTIGKKWENGEKQWENVEKHWDNWEKVGKWGKTVGKWWKTLGQLGKSGKMGKNSGKMWKNTGTIGKKWENGENCENWETNLKKHGELWDFLLGDMGKCMWVDELIMKIWDLAAKDMVRGGFSSWTCEYHRNQDVSNIFGGKKWESGGGICVLRQQKEKQWPLGDDAGMPPGAWWAKLAGHGLCSEESQFSSGEPRNHGQNSWSTCRCFPKLYH